MASSTSTQPWDTENRQGPELAATAVVRDTCKTLAVMVRDKVNHPLPILLLRTGDLLALPVFTDTSVHLSSNAS